MTLRAISASPLLVMQTAIILLLVRYSSELTQALGVADASLSDSVRPTLLLHAAVQRPGLVAVAALLRYGLGTVLALCGVASALRALGSSQRRGPLPYLRFAVLHLGLDLMIVCSVVLAAFACWLAGCSPSTILAGGLLVGGVAFALSFATQGIAATILVLATDRVEERRLCSCALSRPNLARLLLLYMSRLFLEIGTIALAGSLAAFTMRDDQLGLQHVLLVACACLPLTLTRVSAAKIKLDIFSQERASWVH
jgi:hypothetical protein